MQDYVYWIGVVYKGIKAIAGSILDAVLIDYPLPEIRITVYFVSDASDFIQDLFMGFLEPQPRSWVAGVQHRAVAKDNRHPLDSLIAVLGRAAAHAAGIVGSDTSDHATVDRSWIRSYLPFVGNKISVSLSADHSWCKGNPPPVVVDRKLLPSARYNQQH